MYKNTVDPDRPQMTIWRTRIGCYTAKNTNIHSEYVIHIVFPLQEWLHERASMLRLYVHSLPYYIFLPIYLYNQRWIYFQCKSGIIIFESA